MRIEDDVDAPDSVDLDGDLDKERYVDDEEKEYEDETNEMEDDEVDQNEDDGKETWTIGQGEMIDISADNVDTTADNQPIMLHEQGQKFREHTLLRQPLAPARWAQIPETRP